MSGSGEVRADFAVIGAGVVGSAVAWCLQKRGARVALVDGSLPGQGVTAAGFGWINAFEKDPIDYFRLNVLGLEAYHRLAETNDAGWFHPSGYLRLAYDSDAENYNRRVVRRLSERGYSAEFLSRKDVEGLEPGIVCTNVLSAAYLPRDGWLDGPAMVTDLVSRAVNMGATLIVGDPVESFSTATGRVVSATLASGTKISAGAFVCCCGAESPAVGAQVGVRIPLVSRGVTAPSSESRQEWSAVGFTVFTTPVRAGVRAIVRGPSVTVRPDTGRGLAIGRSAGHSWDDHQLLGSIQLLLDEARELIPGLADAHVSGVHVGMRPLPVDDVSIVGWAPEVARFYVVVTHSGATLALFLGDVVAQELVDNIEVPELSSFRLTRFHNAGG